MRHVVALLLDYFDGDGTPLLEGSVEDALSEGLIAIHEGTGIMGDAMTGATASA